jgi:hypothetical protein
VISAPAAAHAATCCSVCQRRRPSPAADERREAQHQRERDAAADLRPAAPERRHEGRHVGPAPPGVAREAALDHAAQPRRDTTAPRRRTTPTREHGGPQLVEGVARERTLAEQHLPGHDGPAELIDGRAGLLAAPLLRGHVRGRAEDIADAGQLDGRGARAREARGARGGCGGVAVQRRVVAVDEAEVHDADAAVVAPHDVVGLQIAVDEADGVRRGDASRGVEEHVQQLGPAARRGAGPRAERLARDELHGDPHAARVDPDVVDGDDVGVREPGERLGLAQQPGLAVAAAGQHQLDGDLAIELGVVRGEHLAHAAGADAIEEDIATDRGPAGQLGGPALRSGVDGRRPVDGLIEPGHGPLDRRAQRGVGAAHRLVCRAVGSHAPPRALRPARTRPTSSDESAPRAGATRSRASGEILAGGSVAPSRRPRRPPRPNIVPSARPGCARTRRRG